MLDPFLIIFFFGCFSVCGFFLLKEIKALDIPSSEKLFLSLFLIFIIVILLTGVGLFFSGIDLC